MNKRSTVQANRLATRGHVKALVAIKSYSGSFLAERVDSFDCQVGLESSFRAYGFQTLKNRGCIALDVTGSGLIADLP
jgi:hypothetical protein